MFYVHNKIFQLILREMLLWGVQEYEEAQAWDLVNWTQLNWWRWHEKLMDVTNNRAKSEQKLQTVL